MRTIDAGLTTALAAQTGIRRQLLALEFAGGTLRVTTAGQNVRATTPEDGDVLWYAMGGALTVGAVEEKAELAGSGMELVASGVDQTIVDLLLSDQCRGRLARAYEIRIDPTAGTVIGTPLRTCRGRMNGQWKIDQTKAGARSGPSTVTVKTKVTDLGADLDHTSGIQMNLGSHQLYYPGDTFMANVAGLANRTIYWDGTTPTRLKPTSNG